MQESFDTHGCVNGKGRSWHSGFDRNGCGAGQGGRVLTRTAVWQVIADLGGMEH